MAVKTKKQNDIEGLTMTVKAFFKKRNDITLVFLFGSIISKKSTVYSDIDIGIFTDRTPDFFETANIREDLTGLLKREVDIVVLNEASPVLKMQVLKKGKMVFEKERNCFARFYGETVKEYEDLKLVRKICEDNILRGRIYA